jgi:hypothetical protein
MSAMTRLIALVFCFLLSSLAHAEACVIGKVVRVVGQVTLQRQAHSIAPFEGLGLCQGDRISTAADSIADLRLRDGTLLTVGKGSELVLREFHLYKQKPNVALFDLIKGAFRGITGLISARPHRFEINTPVATIGIRGTTFWGGFGLSGDKLDVVMLEGHGVYVKNAAGEVDLNAPGQGTTVGNGEVPAAAKTWPDAKVQRAIATITVALAGVLPNPPANSGN